jgi:hypothetical protein
MTPTTFEDRLLDELRTVVAARPAPAAGPQPRRLRLVLATGAIAATTVGVIVLSGGDSAAPAYAVERQPDGSVTVEIRSLRDASGLQEKLRAAGIPAVVDYTPIGKMCRAPRGRPATVVGRKSMKIGIREGRSTTFTITRGSVRPGQTLVIMSSIGAGASSLGTEVVEGPVAPCQLIDAPPLPAPGPSKGGARGPSFSTGGAKRGGTTAGPSTSTHP